MSRMFPISCSQLWRIQKFSANTATVAGKKHLSAKICFPYSRLSHPVKYIIENICQDENLHHLPALGQLGGNVHSPLLLGHSGPVLSHESHQHHRNEGVYQWCQILHEGMVQGKSSRPLALNAHPFFCPQVVSWGDVYYKLGCDNNDPQAEKSEMKVCKGWVWSTDNPDIVTGQHQVLEILLQVGLLQQLQDPRPSPHHHPPRTLPHSPPLDLSWVASSINVFHCSF